MSRALVERLNDALRGRYVVVRAIGRGGSAIVFLARDVRHERQVALKVLRPEIADALGPERFLREIRIASRLTHPNILSLIDSGEADGLLWYVTFYVAGESLRDLLDRERHLPVPDAVRLARETAEALGHAHQLGVVHRDVKPGNILVESGHALVADFGIAKAIDEAAGDQLTRTGFALGTPVYMSPEQASGGEVDGRSDVYSLACVLFEMLAGVPPFQGSTPQAVLARKAIDTPPKVRVVRDTVPEHVESALIRALARVPADRFATAEGFAAALAGEVRPGVARPPRRTSAMSAPWNSQWVSWALGAAAVAIVGLAVMSMTDRSTPEPLQPTFSRVTAQPGVEDWPGLSPDGMWVVYAGDGEGDRDIFLLSVGGNLPINLTGDSDADDYAPSFSPGGERIAFRSERQGGGLFVMGRTGEAARRVSDVGHNPRWSPDGTRLAYGTEHVDLFPNNWETHSEVWVVDVETGERQRIDEGDAVQPTWSPDGRWLTYVGRMVEPTRMDLWIKAIEGGERRSLTSDASTDWSPVWSPDGAYIYFASDRGGSTNLWRLPMNERSGQATGPPEPVTTPASFASHPSLSADGGRLAFYSQIVRTMNIEKAPFDPATASVGDPVPLTTGSNQWSSPDPTADGAWVAFYSIDLPEGDLYVIRGDGTGLRRLSGDEALDRMPRWSPDGSSLAYFSNRSGVLQLWVIGLDGSGNRQLTDNEFSGFAVWSPDGSRIAVNGTPPGAPSGQGVFIFDPAVPWSDQEPTVLPPPDSSIGQFTVNDWSPDGARLAGMFGVADEGIIIHTLGSDTYERLTDFGQWPVWLPDSRRLLFVSGGSSFYVLDSATGEVREVFRERWDVLGPPRMTADGRQIFYPRRRTEGDIWLATMH